MRNSNYKFLNTNFVCYKTTFHNNELGFIFQLREADRCLIFLSSFAVQIFSTAIEAASANEQTDEQKQKHTNPSYTSVSEALARVSVDGVLLQFRMEALINRVRWMAQPTSSDSRLVFRLSPFHFFAFVPAFRVTNRPSRSS